MQVKLHSLFLLSCPGGGFIICLATERAERRKGGGVSFGGRCFGMNNFNKAIVCHFLLMNEHLIHYRSVGRVQAATVGTASVIEKAPFHCWFSLLFLFNKSSFATERDN